MTELYAVNKPISAITVDIDCSVMDSVIEQISKKEKKNISYGDLIAYYTAKALEKYPIFNSNYKEEIMIFENIDIGYYINLGKGSKIAVVKETNKKNLLEYSSNLKECALNYLRGKLSEEPYTFIITNLSPFENILVHPPLFESCSSSLAIAGKHILFDKGEEKKKIYLTLSFDSRVSDCQTATEFLNEIKKLIHP